MFFYLRIQASDVFFYDLDQWQEALPTRFSVCTIKRAHAVAEVEHMTDPDKQKDEARDGNTRHHEIADGHNDGDARKHPALGAFSHGALFNPVFRVFLVQSGIDEAGMKLFAASRKAESGHQHERKSGNERKNRADDGKDNPKKSDAKKKRFFNLCLMIEPDVPQGHDGVSKEHAPSGIAHHFADQFAFFRLVAVDFALGAECFGFHERTF